MSDTFTSLAAPMPTGPRTVRLSPDKHEEWMTSALSALLKGEAFAYGVTDPRGREHAVFALKTPSDSVWGLYDFIVTGV